MYDNLKKQLKNTFFSIIIENPQYFKHLQPIINYWGNIKDVSLADSDLFNAMGLNTFIDNLTSSPFMWVIPPEKTFEYCLKAILMNYVNNSLANSGDFLRSFSKFLEDLKYNGYNKI